MELTDQNKDDLLNIISREIEQEMLLQVAKEQAGIRNVSDVLQFLSFYNFKYTETNARDGKKYWKLTKEGRELLAKGGFMNRELRELKEKRILYALIIALVIIVALFVWSEFRIL